MNSGQEKRKLIVKSIMDKMSYEQREKVFSQLVMIDAKHLYDKAMFKAFEINETGQTLEEYSYAKASSIFQVSAKDVSVLLNPLLDAVLRENAKEYREVYEHLDSLVEILTRTFVRMFSLPVFKNLSKPSAELSLEEANDIRSNKCFSLSMDEIKERVNKANELKDFDISKLKK